MAHKLLWLCVVVDSFYSAFGAQMVVGGVTDVRARFRVTGYEAGSNFIVKDSADQEAFRATITSKYMAFEASSLTAGTQYSYGTETERYTFKTFPVQGAPANITVAFGNCAKREAMDHDIYNSVKSHDPDLVCHVGDLVYADIVANDTYLFDAVYDLAWKMPAGRNLFSNTPMSYIYDDHDFGGNNAMGDDNGAQVAARSGYLRNFPHYDLIDRGGTGSLFQAWTVGRVRFLQLDTRTEGSYNTGFLSTAQMDVWKAELADFERYALVVCIYSYPWHADEDIDPNRQAMADYIASIAIDNLMFISGDQHSLAVDDGSNGDYTSSSSGPGGFPVFYTGPFYAFGKAKGGPYTEGCVGYKWAPNSHYGIMEVTDIGGNGACVQLTGYAEGTKALSYSFCTPNPLKDGIAGADSCDLPYLPDTAMALGMMGSVMIALLFFTPFLPQLRVQALWYKRWGFHVLNGLSLLICGIVALGIEVFDIAATIPPMLFTFGLLEWLAFGAYMYILYQQDTAAKRSTKEAAVEFDSINTLPEAADVEFEKETL